ncbi:MAG: YidH family protein [Nitrospiria bacterium]
MEEQANRDPRVYLAAERTFLAWIRTGLALMGFGFVVARFGLFLREFQVIQHDLPQHSSGLSTWFGIALVVVGILVNLLAALNHIRQIQAFNRGDLTANRPSFLAIGVAFILAIVGTAMAVYLVWVR